MWYNKAGRPRSSPIAASRQVSATPIRVSRLLPAHDTLMRENYNITL
ncbi:MAG: hypothetical protein LBQ66_08775 [Planctomycetaceae bacterium]|nr:hypothetical protein [Planctomycetaceae bacterium]